MKNLKSLTELISTYYKHLLNFFYIITQQDFVENFFSGFLEDCVRYIFASLDSMSNRERL